MMKKERAMHNAIKQLFLFMVLLLCANASFAAKNNGVRAHFRILSGFSLESLCASLGIP